MVRRIAVSALALALVAVGCKEDKTEAPAQTPLMLVASPDQLSANGSDSSLISVSAGALPIALVTSRGTFENGQRSVQVTALPALVALTTCDARVTASCAGPATVTAVGADGATRAISVYMEGFETCSNGRDDTGDGDVDCADAQCPMDSPCSATGLTCSSAGLCNKCTGNGGTAEGAGETSCSDGHDNDCDGLVDCADPSCAAKTCTMATNATGVCDSGACVCDASEDAEATCGDGRDNDCDGTVDCADPDCTGDVCDTTRGLTCSGATTAQCNVCPGGATSEGATQCADGKDNDCDGVFDCADSDCADDACNRYGAVCSAQNGVPTCGCPSGATLETSCSDGVDDDCDGQTDCADEDCQPSSSGGSGMLCDARGRACTAAGTCACAGTVELCGNYDVTGAAIDDDCDGKANCSDYDCRPTTPGAPGETCSREGEYGMACDATGACSCTGNGGTPEVNELSCDDGIDNDCDFLMDCEDPDCGTRTCGPAGATCDATTTACVCPGGASESSCSDGVDNNCNGKTDCEEASCASLACDGTAPTYLCLSGVCSDPATQYGVTVTPARTRIPADGVAETEVTIAVTFNGRPKVGVPVTISVSPATLGTITPASANTDSLGRIAAVFRSAGPTGVATVTATVSGVLAKGSAKVELPAIGEIRVLEGSGGIAGVQYPVMGVKTSGWQEQNQLTIEVVDAEAKPYPAGLAVTFEHRTLGGSTLSDPVNSGSCLLPTCVRSVTATGEQGTATVRLYSGTVAGVVGVSAAAQSGGVPRTFELPRIAIVGAKANAGHLSVVCDPWNVPALADTTCHTSNIDAPFTCVALLKDRYNNTLGRGTTVSFMSEAGAVGPPAQTPEYDPAKAPAEQGDLGSAVELINTLGAKLPKDVPAYGPGVEESVTTPADMCGITQRSPRDGVVTVVAWTPGEEAFFDANGDGGYDLGEPFVDLPEPYVDYNDNDTRDGDEPFIDSDGDQVWDDANGVWDESTNVWTKTIVVYSGMPAFLRMDAGAGDRDYLSRWVAASSAGLLPGPTPVATFAVRPAFPADTFIDCNANQRRDVAVSETYTDSNTNGQYDVGEPFSDCDADGVRQAVTAEPYNDVNSNGSFDPFPSLATSNSFWVIASDSNLNRLDQSTSYAVDKIPGSKVEVSYYGQDKVPDRYGLAFTFQPCLSSNTASCALDCADVTTATEKRCILRTRIGGYGYGYGAGVTIKGGTEAEGPTAVQWQITLFGEKLVIPISGTNR